MSCNEWKETEIGKIPKHWEVCILSNLVDIQNGYAFKSKLFSDNGNPVIKIKNVNGKVVDLNECQLYPYELCEKLEKFKLKNEDILIAMTGAGSVGRVSKFLDKDNKSYYLNQRVGKIMPKKDKLNNEFLFQILSTSKYEKILFDLANGSGQPNLSPTLIGLVKIPLPPLEEQEKIANILSCLDDKIELNNEMNKTLEEMAQSIFKRWFVDFEFPNEDGEPYKSSGGEMVYSELGMIPKGWEVTELREIFVFKKGKKPKEILNIKEDEQYKKYLTIDVLNQKSKLYATVDKMIECSNDDILMVMDGASSGSIYTGMNGIVASTLAKLEVKNSILKPYIYQLLKYKEVDIKCHLTGSAIPHTDKAYIHSQKVALPKNLEELKTMNKILKYIMDKIRINKVEVEKLRITRDTLLPKLMSGEIKVN